MLRTLIPGLLFLTFTADLGLRFLPPNRVMFRAWEAAKTYRTQEPFAANFVYDNPRSYGDLANLGNLRSLRQYRREVFTTDAFGYRRTPGGENLPISMLVLGNSYAVGSGVSDSETLAAQIAQLGHVGVYNGAGVINVRDIDALIKRLHFTHSVIIYKQWEQDDESVGEPVLQKLPQNMYRIAAGARVFIGSAILYSPLKTFLTRSYGALQDDAWLPNAAAKNVEVRTLKNGQPMLFQPGEFTLRRVAQTHVFAELSALASATGNQLVVLLVPDKNTVYYPLLETPIAFPQQMPPPDSSVGGARVLDLTDLLREKAASGLSNGDYYYLIDDTHWSALGTKTIAQAILEFLKR